MTAKRRYYQKSGLNGLMSRVKAKGMDAIDQRSAGAKALAEWKADLLQDLGGDLSAQKATLVDLAVRTKLYIDHIDLFLMSQESLVNKRRRSVYPVVQQRNTLVNSLVSLLKELGLERQMKPMKRLAEYIAERDAVTTEKRDDEHFESDGGQEAVPEDVQA